MVNVDLKAKPYYLDDQQIEWVENTLSQLTDEEKIGQLFFNLFSLEEDGDFNNNDLTIKIF